METGVLLSIEEFDFETLNDLEFKKDAFREEIITPI